MQWSTKTSFFACCLFPGKRRKETRKLGMQMIPSLMLILVRHANHLSPPSPTPVTAFTLTLLLISPTTPSLSLAKPISVQV